MGVVSISGAGTGTNERTVQFWLAARSWATKWFGETSLLGMLFGPSLGAIYVHLTQLENDGLIQGVWGMKVGDKPRRRHYFATKREDDNA